MQIKQQRRSGRGGSVKGRAVGASSGAPQRHARRRETREDRSLGRGKPRSIQSLGLGSDPALTRLWVASGPRENHFQNCFEPRSKLFFFVMKIVTESETSPCCTRSSLTPSSELARVTAAPRPRIGPVVTRVSAQPHHSQVQCVS